MSHGKKTGDAIQRIGIMEGRIAKHQAELLEMEKKTAARAEFREARARAILNGEQPQAEPAEFANLEQNHAELKNLVAALKKQFEAEAINVWHSIKPDLADALGDLSTMLNEGREKLHAQLMDILKTLAIIDGVNTVYAMFDRANPPAAKLVTEFGHAFKQNFPGCVQRVGYLQMSVANKPPSADEVVGRITEISKLITNTAVELQAIVKGAYK